jgi:hypothetical protein
MAYLQVGLGGGNTYFYNGKLQKRPLRFSGTHSLESRFRLYPVYLTILTVIEPLVSKLQ